MAYQIEKKMIIFFIETHPQVQIWHTHRSSALGSIWRVGELLGMLVHSAFHSARPFRQQSEMSMTPRWTAHDGLCSGQDGGGRLRRRRCESRGTRLVHR